MSLRAAGEAIFTLADRRLLRRCAPRSDRPGNYNQIKKLNETFEKCVEITKIIGNFYNVIPAKAGIHGVSLWIPDISLREIPE